MEDFLKKFESPFPKCEKEKEPDEHTKKFWFNFVTLFYKETEH